MQIIKKHETHHYRIFSLFQISNKAQQGKKNIGEPLFSKRRVLKERKIHKLERNKFKK